MNSRYEIFEGDCLEILKTMENESVDCIITSPPYFQLRDYGHVKQIGLEKTVHEYIEKLNTVFKECKRVLKKGGSLWIVIGDTYCGTVAGVKSAKQSVADFTFRKDDSRFKKKSLYQVPSRLAIAIQDDGWILRNEIIWYKPNAMPQSMKDRFTVDYEKIYFFVKEPKYYFKQQKEPMKTKDTSRPRGSHGSFTPNSGRRIENNIMVEKPLLRNVRTVWEVPTAPNRLKHYAQFPDELVQRMIDAGCPDDGVVLDPFMGSGTTGVVALNMNRKFIGIEISKQYFNLAKQRLEEVI